MTITVRNAPVGARARLSVTAPDGSKRHTFETLVGPGAVWSTGISLTGMVPGSSADLVVLDALGNVVTRSSTTLP